MAGSIFDATQMIVLIPWTLAFLLLSVIVYPSIFVPLVLSMCAVLAMIILSGGSNIPRTREQILQFFPAAPLESRNRDRDRVIVIRAIRFG